VRSPTYVNIKELALAGKGLANLFFTLYLLSLYFEMQTGKA
jgi:hypothetical protein